MIGFLLYIPKIQNSVHLDSRPCSRVCNKIRDRNPIQNEMKTQINALLFIDIISFGLLHKFLIETLTL